MKIYMLILLFNTDVQYVTLRCSWTLDKKSWDVHAQNLLMHKMSIKNS